MARVPKDAQRSTFFEGKNKNANLALLVLMWPANVIQILQNRRNLRCFQISTYVRLPSAVGKRSQGAKKLIILFFFLISDHFL